MLAASVAALVVGLAGAAHAQAFGTNGDATTAWQYIDYNGVHPEPGFNCLGIQPGGSAWCGGGPRSSSTGWSTAAMNTQQGAISGSVFASNSSLYRIRSAAAIDTNWWDLFTVDGGGLPAGTIVDLRLSIDLVVSDFQASIAAPAPYTDVVATINLGGHDAPGIAGMNVSGTGDFSADGIFRVAIDTPFTLYGVFITHTNVDDGNPIDIGRTSAVANYFVDVAGIENLNSASTSNFDVASNFDFGVHVITASGHDYSSIVTSGVPEPAAWAMLIAGLGMTGGMIRRRRSITA
jgi:hypothetical protein